MKIYALACIDSFDEHNIVFLDYFLNKKTAERAVSKIKKSQAKFDKAHKKYMEDDNSTPEDEPVEPDDYLISPRIIELDVNEL